MPRITEAEIARMPDVADATLAETFHWPLTEEAQLYRDCPTAFWLAPGGDDALPPTEGPALEATSTIDGDLAPPVVRGMGTAMAVAVAAAGPIFLAALSLIESGSGAPIERIAKGIALGLVSAPLSVPFGAIAAIVPVFLGVSILAHLGTGRSLARVRSLWAATGAGMGLIIAAAFDAGMTTIPLVFTSIACATIAHRAIDWVEPEFA